MLIREGEGEGEGDRDQVPGTGTPVPVVFAVFAVWYLREPIRWTTIAGFVIAFGATLVFAPWREKLLGTARRQPTWYR